MPVTINDIAKKVGVTKQTVSLILNKKDNPIQISDKTKAKVLAAVKELNYQPNYQAKNLKKRKSYFLGVFVPAKSFHFYTDHLRNGILQGFENSDYEEASLHGYDNLDRAIDAVRSHRVDGLLYVVFGSQIKSFSKNEAKKLTSAGVPFVVVHGISTLKMDYNNVGFNEYQAGYLGTEYLVKQGHKDILLLSRDLGTTIPFIELKDGFRQALTDHDIHQQRSLIFKDAGFIDGCLQLKEIKDTGKLPTAIVTYNDFYALSTIRCLEGIGIRVPEDVAIVAGGEIYSDEGMQKALMGKSLTVVRQPVMERGKRAVELLIDIVENPETHQKPETIIFEPELIRRETA